MKYDDKLKHRLDKEVGKWKEEAGKSLQNEELELEGKLDQLKCEGREKFEQAKDSCKQNVKAGKSAVISKVNDTIDRIRDR